MTETTADYTAAAILLCVTASAVAFAVGLALLNPVPFFGSFALTGLTITRFA